MPPRDPNMPEGTDSIIDGTSDLDGTPGGEMAGSGTTGASGMGSGTGYTGMSQSGGQLGAMSGSTGMSRTASGFEPAGGFDDLGSNSLGGAASDAASKVGQPMDVQSLKTQASDKARDMASQGKDKATEALDSMSRLVSETADTVDDRLGPQYGNYVRKAADALEGFNDSIRGKQVDELFDDARNLVRKSPVVAIGAAAAIGFLLVRLVKSGMPQTIDSDDDFYSGSANARLSGTPPRVDNSYDPVA